MFRVKEGNLDQMGLLFDRHHRALFGFFYHNTGLRDESEDLVQIVFMNMIRSRATFTGSYKFETWMYTIARNALKDYYKKHKRTVAVLDTEIIIAETSTAADRLYHKEEEALLKKALASLNEIDRELIVLSRYRELKYQEISVIMKISEGAIKIRIHRAMKQLRETYLALSQQTIIS